MPRSWMPLITIALVTSGCYTFTPTTIAEVAPGQEVRLRIDAPTAALLQDVRLPGPRLLDGTFLRRSADVVVVEASVGTASDLRGARVLVQEVDVPLSGIAMVEIKTLDRLRTGALVVGGGAAVLAALLNFSAIRGSDGDSGGNAPESQAIPLIRIGVPLGR